MLPECIFKNYLSNDACSFIFWDDYFMNLIIRSFFFKYFYF